MEPKGSKGQHEGLERNSCASKLCSFLNIDPDGNREKLKKLIDENVKKTKKYDRVIFNKECSETPMKMAVELFKKKIYSVTFFTLSSLTVKDVTNIKSYNEIGIVQNEPKKAMA